MKVKITPLLTLGTLIAIVALVTLIAVAELNEAKEGTRAGETYIGSDACKGCHSGQFTAWEDTMHGIDFTAWNYHGTPTNKYTYGGGNSTTNMTGSCTSCHTVGYNQTAIGGFDPAFPYNATAVEMGRTVGVGNDKLLSIGCENCHGPGSAHIGATDKAAAINLYKDQYYESCAGTDDAGCHSGYRQYGYIDAPGAEGWQNSSHAPFDNDPAEDTGMNTYCASCKSPSQYDPTTSYGTGADIAAADYRGITCGDCHETHNASNTNDFQLKWPVEDSCDACHNGGHHETMRTEELSGTPSVDVADYPYMEEVDCVECHMYTTPKALRGTDYETIGHYFEPSIAACVECHNSNLLYNTTTPYTSDAELESMIPDEADTAAWDLFEANYSGAIDSWTEVVEAGQDRFDVQIAEVEELLEEVEELMDVAEANGTWTDDLEELFEQAEFDYELAEHNAKGAHNPAYATALLAAAEGNFEAIIEELHGGTLKGVITGADAAVAAGVTVFINGQNAVTGTDGSYEITDVAPGTYTVSTSLADPAAGVIIHSAAITWQNFTLALDTDGDGTADATDADMDNDGVANADDAFPLDPAESVDTDGDGIGDIADTDDDGDGVLDVDDYYPLDELQSVEPTTNLMMYYVIIIALAAVAGLLAVMLMKKPKAPVSAPPAQPKEPTQSEPPKVEEE